MSFSTEKLEGEPIIIHTMHADYKAKEDADDGALSIITLLDAETEPAYLYLIVDIQEAVFGLDDVVFAANLGARGEQPITHHHNVRETIVVTRSDLLKLAARGLDSDAFGHVAIKVFGTLDEALAYCRGQAG